MSQEKLLLVGMGSESDLEKVKQLRLDGKSITEYAHERGIKVYEHPKSGSHLITSIHRTTQPTLRYAADTQHLQEQGHALVLVLTGGLALALPGVAGAEAYSSPIIGVPTDADAFYNVHKIPDGTPVGVVAGRNGSGLEKAVKIACKTLQLSGEEVNFVVQGSCKNADKVKATLEKLAVPYNLLTSPQEKYSGLTIYLTDMPGTSDGSQSLAQMDSRVELGVFGLESDVSSDMMIMPIRGLQHSVVVGRPVNLAGYTARVVSLTNHEVRAKLKKFREDEAKKYPEYVPITLENFK